MIIAIKESYLIVSKLYLLVTGVQTRMVAALELIPVQKSMFTWDFSWDSGQEF